MQPARPVRPSPSVERAIEAYLRSLLAGGDGSGHPARRGGVRSCAAQRRPRMSAELGAFLESGRAWADAHGHTAADLRRRAGVPTEVLRWAGFTPPRRRERCRRVAGG